jgi:hypothetical protein
MRTPGRFTRRATGALTLVALGAAAVAFGLAGCGSTRLSEHWRDPAWSGPALNNVLVMVVRKEPARRRLWEDAFVAALRKRGINATPSYRTFPDSVPSEDAIDDVMQQTSYDGIILSRRLGTAELRHYVPPTVVGFGGRRWGGFYSRYRTYYGAVYQPGYVEAERVVTNETSVWDARKNGNMVWSATSRSSNPSSANDLAGDLSDVAVSQMAKDGIVP